MGSYCYYCDRIVDESDIVVFKRFDYTKGDFPQRDVWIGCVDCLKKKDGVIVANSGC